MGKGIQTRRQDAAEGDCELDRGGRDDAAEGTANWIEVEGCACGTIFLSSFNFIWRVKLEPDV